MNKKLYISLVVGTIVSAVTLYLAFRNVPFSQLIEYLGTINYLWVIPSTLVLLISFGLRVVRWRIILRPAKQIGFWEAHNPLMIGFMMNCILPGRVGELARPIILQRRSKVPFTTGLATVAAERVLDLVLLITFLAVVLATVHIDPNLNMTFGKYQLNKDTLEAIADGMMRLCLALILGIILVSIDYTRTLLKKAILLLPHVFRFGSDTLQEKITNRVAGPLVGITDNIASGFYLVRYPKSMILISMLTVIIWILSALSYYLMALGCPGINLSFLEIAAVMIVICFFIALPSVPGFWGLWEAGGVFAMALFGVAPKEAAGFTLANHAVQMFPVILVGLAAAIATGVNILQVAKTDAPTDADDRESLREGVDPAKTRFESEIRNPEMKSAPEYIKGGEAALK